MHVLNDYEVPKIAFFGFTCPLKKLKFFVISERELFIITFSSDRLRTGDDWCEFMTDNSSLTSHLVVRVSDIFFFVQMSVLLKLRMLASFLCGLHEVYSHIMVSPDLFIYLFIYVFIYLSTRVEHLSRGLV